MASDERSSGDESPDESPASTPAADGAVPGGSELIEASPDEVFDVLIDPDTYPDWLVGAQHIRSVDDDWPTIGSKFHHAIGIGPAAVPGSTSVLRCTRPDELVLAAGMGPFGEAAVRFALEPANDGTVVRFEELPVSGVVRLAWRVASPMVSLALWGRNAVSLAALSRVVAERRAG